jgi:Outer membrane protein beta-barrel domain
MEDKDFDNIFGDKLKKQKDFPFSEQKWTVLERQYDQLLGEKRYKRLLLFGGISLLTLLSSLFCTLSLLNDTNKKLDHLTHEIHFLPQEKMSSLTPSVFLDDVPKSDTIFHKIVVYRYDTIYQTVIRRDIFQSNLNGLNNKNQKLITENPLNEQGNKKDNALKSPIIKSENFIILDKKAELITEKGLKDEQPISEQLKTINNKQNDSINLVKTTSTAKPVDSLSEKVVSVKRISPLSINADTASKNGEKSFEKELEKQKDKKRPIISQLKIKGYELGITGGAAFINNSSIVNQAGFSFGFKGGVLFGRRLQLIGEVQGLNLSFETQRFSQNLNIPTISPPTANVDLRSVNASQLYWQVALGLKYQFMDGKRWQPYLSMGVVGQAASDEEFNYKFINLLTKESINIKSKRKGSEFETGILRTSVGVNYRIRGKFQGFLEGGYDFKFDKSPRYMPIGQVKLGLLYRF